MVCGGKIKSLVHSAFMQLMGGIVRLALRNGLTCTELTDICKLLYVKIAAEEYGIRGRETNDSRIEVMTGIDRKEVKKIKGRTKNINFSDSQPDKMAKLLSEWHTNPAYTTANKPKELSLEGAAPSFSSLVHEFAPGTAAITVLREFRRSKVVVDSEGGLLKVVKQAYIPNYHINDLNVSPDFVNPEAISLGSSMLTDHINTIFHNLYKQDKKLPEKLDMRATNHEVKLSKAPEFYRLIDKLGMEFLTHIDNWLSENQVDPKKPEAAIRLGVGIYSIEGVDRNVE